MLPIESIQVARPGSGCCRNEKNAFTRDSLQFSPRSISTATFCLHSEKTAARTSTEGRGVGWRVWGENGKVGEVGGVSRGGGGGGGTRNKPEISGRSGDTLYCL